MKAIFTNNDNSNTALYIHIPFCISKCRYCDFFSLTCKNISDEYIEAVCNQIIFFQNKYSIRSWKSVYIGGGTPSLLTFSQLNKLFSVINLDSNCETEITIEVNPDDITKEFLINLSKSPVNRISCGIQSMNDDVLKIAGRRATLTKNEEALVLLNKFWNKRLSLDLICGLPGETEESFFYALNQLLKTNVEHISMYSLVVEEETPLGNDIINSKIEYDYDFADELWLKGKKILESHGFLQYEISNFSKPDKESKHNLVYWNHMNYAGCGSGGTGTIYFENGEGERFTNTSDISEYIRFWLNHQNNQDLELKEIPGNYEYIDLEISKFEFFMMGMRKNSGISDVQYETIFNEKLPQNFLKLIKNWEEEGNAVIKKNGEETFFALSKKGILFLNRFIENLDL